MNDTKIEAAQAELQKNWEEEFHHLFMLMRRRFRPGTLLTIAARLPEGDPELSDFCWTQETKIDELRAFLDRLDERQKKREIKPDSQIIKPNGFKVKD